MKASESISMTQRRARHFLHSFNRTSFKYLFEEITLTTSIIIASCIATCYIFYLFPSRFLAGQGGLFERLEPLTSLSGWWAFKNGAWHFPLFGIRLLNSPEGANIAFTNSMPLVALFLKPFKGLFSNDFHYFGIWFAIAYLAQAIASTLAIRSLGQRTILATLASSMMALMMPVLLWQTDNIPLVSQAYLLFGLSLYFTGLKRPYLFKEISYIFTLLLALALLTHPYLLLMTSAFYVALLGEHGKQSLRHRQDALTALATTSAVIIAIMIVGGYFNQTLRSSGYGRYSMNLLSPFSGGKLGQRIVNATAGQVRGFNYLGVGVLCSLLLTAIVHRKHLSDTFYQHRTLISILVLLTLFAISNHVFLGKHTVIRYPLFFPFNVIADIFRSSGRLFWPCGYTLMIVGLVGVLRLEDKLLSLLAVCFILSVQFYDTTPFRNSLYRTVRLPVATSPHWNRLVRSVSSVQLYPAYGCGNHATENIAFWQALAVRNSRQINSAYRANKKINCAVKHTAFNKPLQKGKLYIVSKDHRPLPHHIAFAMDQGWCRRTEKGVICIKNTDYEWWKAHLPGKETKRYTAKASTKVAAKPKKKQYDWGWPESDW